jgi:hypothetical protein
MLQRNKRDAATRDGTALSDTYITDHYDRGDEMPDARRMSAVHDKASAATRPTSRFGLPCVAAHRRADAAPAHPSIRDACCLSIRAAI